MRVHYLESDSQRIQWLKRVVKAATLEPGLGAGLLPNKLINQATSLQTSFQTAGQAKAAILSQRAELVILGNEAYGILRQTYHSMRAGIVNRARLLRQSNAIYKIYGLNLDGTSPPRKGRHGLLQQAEVMVAGEAVAVERGYDPVAFPPITMLATAVDAAKAAFLAIDGANLEHQEALEVMIRQRAEVAALFNDIFAYLRYALRGMKAATRREILRRYGFFFRGEASPVEDAQPPTTQEPSTPTQGAAQEPPVDDTDPVTDPPTTAEPEPSTEGTPVP